MRKSNILIYWLHTPLIRTVILLRWRLSHRYFIIFFMGMFSFNILALGHVSTRVAFSYGANHLADEQKKNGTAYADSSMSIAWYDLKFHHAATQWLMGDLSHIQRGNCVTHRKYECYWSYCCHTIPNYDDDDTICLCMTMTTLCIFT